MDEDACYLTVSVLKKSVYNDIQCKVTQRALFRLVID